MTTRKESMYNPQNMYADPDRTQKKLNQAQRKAKRASEKAGRKNNRGTSKGQKSATGRRSWNNG